MSQDLSIVVTREVREIFVEIGQHGETLEVGHGGTADIAYRTAIQRLKDILQRLEALRDMEAAALAPKNQHPAS